MDVESLRKDFSILKNNFAYLDNAATSLTPDSVVKKANEYYEHYNANIHRGAHELTTLASEMYEQAHETIARFLGCSKQQIIMTKNATEALNMVGKGREWQKAVVTDIEHHSNYLPWKNKEIFALEKDFSLDFDKFQQSCKDADIVSFTHVSNVTGNIMPAKEMVKIAQENGALTCIDMAQSVPHIPVNLKQIPADFIAFSGHKMLGPTGTGVLFVRDGKSIEPLMLGGGTIKDLDTLADMPEKFEAGTPNIAGAVGLAEAVHYLQRIGLKNIENYEKELVKIILDELLPFKWFEYLGAESIENKTGVVSFNIKNVKHHEIAQILNEQKIYIRSGHHCCIPIMKKFNIQGTARASPYFYNTVEEITRFVETVKNIGKSMS